MSNFGFLLPEWPGVHEAAVKAEQTARSDPRTACFYVRRALELALYWAYKADGSLHLPYDDKLSALIHEPTFKQAAGEAVFAKARLINIIGNRAVHDRHRPLRQSDSLTAVEELFHVCYWLAHTYARKPPSPGVRFDATQLPTESAGPRQTVEKLQALEAALAERDEKLSALLADKANVDEQLVALRNEVAKAKKANASYEDTHDYSEAETRTHLIDALLFEADWDLTDERDREFEVSGMPTKDGHGYVDYVLWGDDGKPLGLVEAKRTTKSPKVGRQQAKLYADCLKRSSVSGRSSSTPTGTSTWIWDDRCTRLARSRGSTPRTSSQLIIQRRASRRSLATADINEDDRRALLPGPRDPSHLRGLRAAARASRRSARHGHWCRQDPDGHRRWSTCSHAANWVKRVLFLADRHGAGHSGHQRLQDAPAGMPHRSTS